MAQATATNETQPFTLQIYNDWANDPQESVTQNRWGKAGYIILNIIFPFILVLIDLLTSACLRCGSKSLKGKTAVQIKSTTDAATTSAADAAKTALNGEVTNPEPAKEGTDETPSVDGDNLDTPPTPKTAERLAQEAKKAEAAKEKQAAIKKALQPVEEKLKEIVAARDFAVKEAKTSKQAQEKVDAIKEAKVALVNLLKPLNALGQNGSTQKANKAADEALIQAKQAVKALKEKEAAKPANRHKAALTAVKAARKAYDKKHNLKKEKGANNKETQAARSAMITAGKKALKAIAYSQQTNEYANHNYLDQRTDRGHWVKHAESAMETT